MFVRKFVSLAFLLALALPVVSHAENADTSRAPAAAKHHKGKKAKKGKGKKAKGSHHAKAKGKKGSHAPAHNTADAGAGAVNHTPPEMKEDLPAPSAESTTEH